MMYYNRLLDDRSYLRIYYERNIKYKDSLHLACVEAANADVLLATDRKFMNNCSRIKTYTRVPGPNQWLLEVLYL